MKISRALIGFLLLTLLYLGLLVWLESKNQVFYVLPSLLATLPALIVIALASYTVRYARWRWLLGRAGHRIPVASGALAYVAGFAFTATPGKAGELVRIRYYAPIGVPAARVVAAFVYERVFDLIAVLLLASCALFTLDRLDIFFFAFGFVLLLTLVIVLLALNPRWFERTAVRLNTLKLPLLARACTTLRDGLAACRVWARPLEVSVSFASGLLAWLITALAFVYLLVQLGITVPTLAAIAIYPLAMLAGAASLLPGGIGSTELAIVALLSAWSVPLAAATLAAVGIRIASLWFAVLCGIACLAVLEWQMRTST